MMNLEDIIGNFNFLSDIYTLDNDFDIIHIVNESNEVNLENVSVIIDFVKPITPCHIKNKTGFANVNKISR